jgi:hypothetical protein
MSGMNPQQTDRQQNDQNYPTRNINTNINPYGTLTNNTPFGMNTVAMSGQNGYISDDDDFLKGFSRNKNDENDNFYEEKNKNKKLNKTTFSSVLNSSTNSTYPNTTPTIQDQYSDSDSDEYESSDDELIPRRIQRSKGGIRETIERFQNINKTEEKHHNRLENEKYIETTDHNELLSDARNHAKIMASIWRYICLICTISWSILVNLMFFSHLFFDKDIVFYRNVYSQVDLGQFLIIHLPLCLSTLGNIALSHDLPRFTDFSIIFSTSLTLFSTIIYFLALFFLDLFSLHELILPLLNIVAFGIVWYAYFNIQQSYQLINELKKARYKYDIV